MAGSNVAKQAHGIHCTKFGDDGTNQVFKFGHRCCASSIDEAVVVVCCYLDGVVVHGCASWLSARQ